MVVPAFPRGADSRFVQWGFAPSEVIGRPFHWLLDLNLGGQVIRLSDQELDVTLTDKVGDAHTWRYYGGLEFDEQVEDPVALLSDMPDSRSISMTLHLSPQWKISEFVEQGVVLGSATGVLRFWPEGSTRAMTVLVGMFRDPTFDTDDTPLIGTLEEDPSNDRSLYPSQDARVMLGDPYSRWGATWGSPVKGVIGEYYPDIFGSPGQQDPQIAGSPALVVHDATVFPAVAWWLVAGHPVIATSVRIINASQENYQVMPVYQERDGLGRLVSVAKWSLPLPIGWGVDDDYWAEWEVSTATPVRQYGMYADDVSLPEGRRGAGDILQYVLRQSGLRWDEGRVAALTQRLNGFRLDTYLMADADNRISPWEWIQDALLPILPISPRIGPGGLHFVFWDYTAVADDAIASIVCVEGVVGGAAANAVRVSEVETTPIDDVVHTWDISYMVDADTGDPGAVFTMSGDPAVLDSGGEGIIPDLHLIRGVQAYEQPVSETFTIDTVRDHATATVIGQWKARSQAVQYYEVSYLVDAEIAVGLEAGDVVTITDEGRGWSSKPCLVDLVVWSARKMWEVGLRIPAHDIGSAG